MSFSHGLLAEIEDVDKDDMSNPLLVASYAPDIYSYLLELEVSNCIVNLTVPQILMLLSFSTASIPSETRFFSWSRHHSKDEGNISRLAG